MYGVADIEQWRVSMVEMHRHVRASCACIMYMLMLMLMLMLMFHVHVHAHVICSCSCSCSCLLPLQLWHRVRLDTSICHHTCDRGLRRRIHVTPHPSLHHILTLPSIPSRMAHIHHIHQHTSQHVVCVATVSCDGMCGCGCGEWTGDGATQDTDMFTSDRDVLEQ